MKFVLQIILSIVASIVISILITTILNRLSKNKLKRSFNINFTIALTIILLVIDILFDFANYNKANSLAKDYLNSTNEVNVVKTDFGYQFDGSGSDDAIIFYPGAKVECEAYAPLLFNLAKDGIDTFLIDMPFNYPFFGINKASSVLDNYNYNNYYMMGHSLGGVMASTFLLKNESQFDGIIFLASYSTKKLPDNIKVLSIYGTDDGCLNINEYEKNKTNFPPSYKEIIIKGGNHSQFGSYGTQADDNDAKISFEDQQQITIDNIKFLLN